MLKRMQESDEGHVQTGLEEVTYIREPRSVVVSFD